MVAQIVMKKISRIIMSTIDAKDCTICLNTLDTIHIQKTANTMMYTKIR